MAQVVQNADLRARVEHYLDYVRDQWSGIPDLAAEWADWDEESRVTFVWNWAVPRDRLHQLEQWADQGLLTPEQQARYERLLVLVAEQRPKIERLLAS